jgi:hypothetical protein
MHDAGFVRGLDACGDLSAHLQRLVHGQRAAREARGKGLARDELQHQVAVSLDLLDPVDAGHVRVVERRQQAGFAFEASEAFGVLCETIGKRLDRDVALEAGVARGRPRPSPPAPRGAVIS